MSTPAKTMNPALRGPLVHLAIVGVSIAVAAVLWSRDDDAQAIANEVTVWAGHQGDVQHVVFQSKTKKVVIDAKTDAQGSYLVGTVDMEPSKAYLDAIATPSSLPPRAPPSGSAAAGAAAPSGSAAAGAAAPSGSAMAGAAAPSSSAMASAPAPSGSARAGAAAPSGSAMAGAPAPPGSARAGVAAPSGSAMAGAAPSASASAVASAAASPAPSSSANLPPVFGMVNPSAPGRVLVTFVSVNVGAKVSDALAPLKAIRALGKITDAQASELGLAELDTSLTVKLTSGEKKLFLGGITAGGGDRYVKDATSGEAFVISGDALRYIESAESWLIERDIHDWKLPDALNARMIVGQKTRKLIKIGAEGKKAWGDINAKHPDDAVNNWLGKLDQLRPLEYLTTLPPGKEVVCRIEYSAPGPVGFLELVRVPGGREGKLYFIQTERTRLWAKVSPMYAEQVELDIALAMK